MIRMNDFTRQWALTDKAVLSAVERVGRSAYYILGEEVRSFEKKLSEFWGLPHSIGVANGTDAIEIGLKILGLRAGERVLTTPMTAFPTTLAIARAGGIPVYVDTDESGLIDLNECEALLARDSGIRFMVPVHLYGHALDLDRLENLRRKHDLQIVEDCAQSIGATWKGRPTGSVGQIATTSFYPTKNLGALGDGGAILTTSTELAQKAYSYRDYGQTAKYVHTYAGMNSRLDELQAAILKDAFLPYLGAWNERRTAIASRYLEGLRNPGIRPMIPAQGSRSAWHLFPVQVEPSKRQSFLSQLEKGGIGAAVHYPRLVSDQECLPLLTGCEKVGTLSRAQRISGGEVSLPIHPFLTDSETTHIVEVCNAWSA